MAESHVFTAQCAPNLVAHLNAPYAPLHTPLHTQLRSMDWAAPWWQPWRTDGQQVAQRILAHASVADALNAQLFTQTSSQQNTAQRDNPHAPQIASKHADTPNQPTMRFVAQSALPENAAYEQFIFDTQQVPTRNNLHDFFNGLAWIVFPKTKRRLNTLQAAEIARHGVQATRGALRDALTVFDENAAFMQTSPELADALRQRQWQRACVHLRAQWLARPPLIFGHALLEKLVTPYKSATAHVFTAQAAPDSIANKTPILATTADWDSAISQQLNPQALVPKPYLPLPVLGVPGWWPVNEDPAFYDDAQVFRPLRCV